MNALIITAGLFVALLAQWLNAKPALPTAVVKLSLVAAGLVFYGLGHGWPVMERAAMLQWFDAGWIWAFALPGAASLIGLAPGMQTQNQEVPPIKEVKP